MRKPEVQLRNAGSSGWPGLTGTHSLSGTLPGSHSDLAGTMLLRRVKGGITQPSAAFWIFLTKSCCGEKLFSQPHVCIEISQLTQVPSSLGPAGKGTVQLLHLWSCLRIQVTAQDHKLYKKLTPRSELQNIPDGQLQLTTRVPPPPLPLLVPFRQCVTCVFQ